jgi:ubiquitin-protein ligase
MDKIWANRVQKEVENLREKPPAGVQLDDRTFFSESDGKCVVYCRCATSKTGNEAAADEDNAAKVAHFVLEIDISVDKRYPFEVPTVKVVEGSNLFPQGAIQDGTNVLNSPADSDIWTPSHSVTNKIKTK